MSAPPSDARANTIPPSPRGKLGGENLDAIVRVFRSWERQCYRSDRSAAGPSNNPVTTATANSNVSNEALREQAKAFFSSIVRSTQVRVEGSRRAGVSVESSHQAGDAVPATTHQQQLRTHSSHEQMLALLLQQLQGPFKATTRSPDDPDRDCSSGEDFVNARASALYLLVGALEGIALSGGGGGNSPNEGGGGSEAAKDGGALNLPLLRLVGNFLLAHCGPLRLSPTKDGECSRSTADGRKADDSGDPFVADDGSEVDATPVREAAILAVTALLRCGTANASSPSGTPQEPSIYEQNVQFRLSLARRAVESRCAADDEEDDDDNYASHDLRKDFDGDEAMEDAHAATETGAAPSQYRTLNGLSALPRSRRSQLFELIRTVIESIQRSRPRDASLLSVDGAFDFCSFAASLLLGESDPRCLLQLLEVFGLMARVFHERSDPVVRQSSRQEEGSRALPWDHILEAVAPYYPIQFTPPPNNVHKITKLQLRRALIAVFDRCTHVEAFSDMVEMVLERIVNDADSDELGGGGGLQGALSIEEQRDAAQDLLWLLTGSADDRAVQSAQVSADGSVEGTATDSSSICKVRYLDVNSVRHLSKALITIFHDASKEIVRRPDPESPTHRAAKETLQFCRYLVSVVARECEATSKASSSPDHWSAFVEEPVRSLAAQLHTPSRVSVAYLACLASSGGNKTLRHVLDQSLPELLDTDFEAFEDPGTAVYGIGAFFSACDSSVHAAEKNGVVLYPHPLKPYRAKAIHKLGELILPAGRTSSIRKAQSSSSQALVHSWNMRIAAVRAIESVVLASPAAHLEEDEVDVLSKVVEAVMDPLLWAERSARSGSECDETDDRISSSCPGTLTEDWLSACSKTLGSLLGRKLTGPTGRESKLDSLMECERVKAILDIAVTPPLLESAATPSGVTSRPRYDRITLAVACTVHAPSASCILGKLSDSLQFALSHNNFPRAESCASCLNVVFRKGGIVAAKAFHSLKEPITAFGIIESMSAFASVEDDMEMRRMNSDVGLSTIRLPATDDEVTKDQVILSRAYKLSTYLRPAYELSDSVPLDALDGLLKLAAKTLPPLTSRDFATLAVTLPLLSAALASSNSKNFECRDVQQLLSDLADLCFNNDFISSARIHVHLCVQHLISKSVPPGVECPARRLLNDIVVPNLKTCVGRKRGGPTGQSCLSDAFTFMSFLGSAAACRGSSSARTADEIITFFVDVACALRASMFSGSDESFTFDVSRIGENDRSTEWTKEIVTEAATCVSSMLATRIPSLSRQRLITKVMTRLSEYEAEESSSMAPKSLGVLITACQVACTSNIQNFGPSNLKLVATVVSAGLAQADVTLSLVASRNRYEVKMLLLASLLKLIAATEADAANNADLLLTGVLRCFAAEAHPTQDIAVKLLALQVLDSMAHVGVGHKGMIAFRPAVIAVLSGAMNHPSSLIRQAAVDVRNSWFTLDQM